MTDSGLREPLKFANNGQRNLMGFYLGLVAIVCLVGVFNPGGGGLGLQLLAGLGTLVFALLAFRFATGSCIVATEGGVHVRAALRRSTYRWNEIRGFRSEQGVVGAVAYRRKVLVIDFVDGRSVPYRALNCKPGGGWVDDAVASLNQQLSALRP